MEKQDLKGLLATCSEPENVNSEIHGGGNLPDTPTVFVKKDEASLDKINVQDKADGKVKNEEVKTDKSTRGCDSARNDATKEIMKENIASSIPENVEGEPHGVVNNDVASIVSEMIEETSTMLVDGHGKANELGKREEIQPDNWFEVVNSYSNKKTKKILRTEKTKPEESPTVLVNSVSIHAKMMKEKMNAVNITKLTKVTQCNVSIEGDEEELEGDVKPESVQVIVFPQVDEDKGVKDLKFCDEIHDDATLPRTLNISETKEEASITEINEQDKEDERIMDEDVKNDNITVETSIVSKEATRNVMNENIECSMPESVEGHPHGVVPLTVSEMTKENSFMLVDGHANAKEKGKTEEVQHDKKFEVVTSSSNMQTKKIVRKRRKNSEETPNDVVNAVSKPPKMKKKMNGASAVILNEAKPSDRCSEEIEEEVEGDAKPKSVENVFMAEGKEENEGIEDVTTKEKVDGSVKKKVKKAEGWSTNTESVAVKLVNAESIAASLVCDDARKEESREQKFETDQSLAFASPNAVPSVEKMDVEDSKDDAYEAGKVDIASDRKPESVKISAVTEGHDRNVKHAKIVKKIVGEAKKTLKVVKKKKLATNAKIGNTNSESATDKLGSVEGVAAMMVCGDISKKKDKQRVKVGNLASGTTNAVSAVERSDVEDLKDDANVAEKECIAPVQKHKSIKKRERPLDNTSSLNAGKPINPDKLSSSAEDKRTTKVDSADKQLKVANGMGFIFMCNAKTKKDCYRYKILGLPESKKDIVAKIYKGMRLFLFDVDRKLMYGIYKAASSGGYNIEPKAFASKYPSQVRFTVLTDCLPLTEDEFKAAIKENYYGRHKFGCQLFPEQVKKLCRLFQKKAWGDADRVASIPSSSTRERKRRLTRDFGRTPPLSYIYEQPISNYHYRREHHAVLDREMRPRDPVFEYQVPHVFYRGPRSYREPLHYSRLPPEYTPSSYQPHLPHFYRY